MAKQTNTLSEKNKAFWALTPAKQRVAIAKDVIKDIESKFLVAQSGTYFQITKLGKRKQEVKVPPKFDKLLKTLKSSGGQCDVCGIGACFSGLVKLGDKVESESLVDLDVFEKYDCVDDSNMRVFLRKIFPSKQLTLIECAFEQSASHQDVYFAASDEEREKARAFGLLYKTDRGRMIAIMQNIIDNKGTFIP